MRIFMITLLMSLTLAPMAFANDIKWNDPPPATDQKPVDVVLDNSQPAAGGAAQPFKKSIIVDDAPPPRKAPKRGNVNVLALPAPFGIIENSVAPVRPRYAPVIVQRAASKAPIKPAAKPSAPADSKFIIRFNKLRIEVSDAMSRWQNAALPVSLGPNLAVFMQTIAVTAQQQPAARIEIRAYASQGGWQSEARRHAMARAIAVYQWLVDQGVRPTQIDWYALGQPGDRNEADRVDILLKKPPR